MAKNPILNTLVARRQPWQRVALLDDSQHVEAHIDSSHPNQFVEMWKMKMWWDRSKWLYNGNCRKHDYFVEYQHIICQFHIDIDFESFQSLDSRRMIQLKVFGALYSDWSSQCLQPNQALSN